MAAQRALTGTATSTFEGSEGIDEDMIKCGFTRLAVFAPVLGLMAGSKASTQSLQKVWEGPAGKGCGHLWILEMPWEYGELFFFLIEKEPTFHGEVVDFERETS